MLQKFRQSLNLKKFLTNNLQYKLLALVFSIVLWMVVVNIEDPEQNKSFTIPITVTNASILADSNQYYEVSGESTTTIRVQANRSILDKLSSADFVATANMENLIDNNKIPIEVTVGRYSGQVTIVYKTSYLNVRVGDLLTKEFVVEAQTVGEPAQGCVVGRISTDPEVVKVAGPEDIVNRIARVVAEVDIEGANAAVTSRSALMYYDEMGQIIDTAKLTLDAYNAAVTVNIESTKTVPINVITSGELSENLRLKGISTNPTVIAVRGPATSLNDLTVVSIPGTVINLSELTGPISTTVDITAYLPSGVMLVDNTQTTVAIDVDIAEVAEKILTVSTDDIAIRNLPEGMKVSFANANFSLRVIAESADLERLTEDMVEASIDCGVLDGDSKEAELEIVLDSIYEIPEQVIVKIHVKVDDTYKKPEPAPAPPQETKPSEGTGDSTDPKTEEEKKDEDSDDNKEESETGAETANGAGH